jgi:katanin p80 WD40 repeat-containing subunit B1
VVRSIWARGDVREAIETMARMNDPAVVVDILNVMADKSNIYTLDMCVILLPLLNDLLVGQYDE